MSLLFPLPPLVPAEVVILAALVIIAAIYDIRFRRIPNRLTATGVLLGLGLNPIIRAQWPSAFSFAGLLFALGGLGLAVGVYFFLYAIRAMGAGDVKLMAAVGALVGWQSWFCIFIVTAIIGGVAALALSLARGRLKKTIWNVGFILSEMKHGRPAYLGKEELDVRSSKSLGLPHGAVIAAGTLLFLAAGHAARLP
jgi:prepilin peptidase CpaA